MAAIPMPLSMSLLLAAITALFLFLSPSPDGGQHPCPGTCSSPLGTVDATLVNACPPKSPRMSCGCRALIGLYGDLRATASISSEIISHLAGPLGPWSPGSRAAGFPLGVSGGRFQLAHPPIWDSRRKQSTASRASRREGGTYIDAIVETTVRVHTRTVGTTFTVRTTAPRHLV